MKPYTEMIANTDVTFDMVPIPGGEFKMGSPAGEKGRKADEGPQVEVKIEPFWMGSHEVTWDEYELWGLGLDQQRREMTKVSATGWDKSADALASPTKPYADMTFGMGKQGYPAICMTQFAAKMYCKWLRPRRAAITACRPRPSGNTPAGPAPRRPTRSATIRPSSATTPGSRTTATRSTTRSARRSRIPGACTTCTATSAEWCLDSTSPISYRQLGDKPVANPVVPVTKPYPQVARGGAWTDEAPLLRSAARRASSPEWKAARPADSQEHLVLHRRELRRLPRGAAVARARRRKKPPATT